MFLPRITKTSTWLIIKNNSQITEVQHPVYDNIYTKTEFEEEFRTLLTNLNGHPEPEPYDYLGFYVEINPLNGCLKFRDEDTKSIFIDWAVELEIIPPLQEIHQGESNSEQHLRHQQDGFNNLPQISEQELAELTNLQRLEQEKSISIQQHKKFQRTESYSQFYKDYLLLSNIWSGCSKNYEFILNNPESPKRKTLEKKLKSGQKKLQSIYSQFIKDYPNMEIFPEFTTEIQEQVNQISVFLST